MKTFQQFKSDSQQFDEGLKFASKAYKIARKTPIMKKVGNVIKNLRTKPKLNPNDYKIMYHGTTQKDASKIVRKGFRGRRGAGEGGLSDNINKKKSVYMTDDPQKALEYAKTKIKYDSNLSPSVVGVRVPTKDVQRAYRDGEYIVPVKGMKSYQKDVKPIKRRKGEVIQDNYQHVKEAKVDLLRAIARVPRGKFTPLNIAQAKGTVRNIRGGFYSPSSNTLAKGLADANKRLKVQSALGNLADPMKNPLAATTDDQTLYRRVIGSSSKKLSKDSKAIFRDLEKSSKNKNLFGPEISQKDIQFAKNVRSVNKKTSQPTAIQQGAGLTDLASISRRMKSSNPETADFARKQFIDRKLDVAKKRLIRKGRRTYKPVDDTDKA